MCLPAQLLHYSSLTRQTVMHKTYEAFYSGTVISVKYKELSDLPTSNCDLADMKEF